MILWPHQETPRITGKVNVWRCWQQQEKRKTTSKMAWLNKRACSLEFTGLLKTFWRSVIRSPYIRNNLPACNNICVAGAGLNLKTGLDSIKWIYSIPFWLCCFLTAYTCFLWILSLIHIWRCRRRLRCRSRWSPYH